MEWGILGDERSWRQPIANWFEVWWKNSVSVPQTVDAPAQALLREEVESELGMSVANSATAEKPALDAAFSSAPANCGRAAAVLKGSSLIDTDSQNGMPPQTNSIAKDLDRRIPQEASVSRR